MYYGLQRNEVNSLCSLAKTGKSYEEIWRNVYPVIVVRKCGVSLEQAIGSITDTFVRVMISVGDVIQNVGKCITDAFSNLGGADDGRTERECD